MRKGIKPEKVKTRPLSSISKTVLRADSPTTSVSSRSSYESKGAIARTKGGLDSFSDEAEDDADDVSRRFAYTRYVPPDLFCLPLEQDYIP